ncbi:hypothetical protein LSCM1_07429 [Leishmania martiniquensis]|uniref:C-type lectin domain-containing protein n=1 Tax=Leishmania martiniquensis TaxID=1580590 RepID=A0A836KUB3_9TRYP|nr:hypothetical protein LSCM1_07429 [Leishmania martiniquensis]
MYHSKRRDGRPPPPSPSLLRRFAVVSARPLLAVLLLVCTVTLPTFAFVYTTTPTDAQLPATYAATHPDTPLQGLQDACNQQGAGVSDRMLMTVRGDVTTMLESAAKGGVVYLGGYYDPASDAWRWWDGLFSSYVFALGPQGTLVASQPPGWATDYPKLTTDGSVGALRYVAFDGSRGGWTNVAGTAALNGVACESRDQIVSVKKPFPWWAILIIVLAVVAVMITIAFCLCCSKKKLHDDDENTELASHSASFTSRRSSLGHLATSSLTTSRTSGTSGSGTSGTESCEADQSSSVASSSRGARHSSG